MCVASQTLDPFPPGLHRQTDRQTRPHRARAWLITTPCLFRKEFASLSLSPDTLFWLMIRPGQIGRCPPSLNPTILYIYYIDQFMGRRRESIYIARINWIWRVLLYRTDRKEVFLARRAHEKHVLHSSSTRSISWGGASCLFWVEAFFLHIFPSSDKPPSMGRRRGRDARAFGPFNKHLVSCQVTNLPKDDDDERNNKMREAPQMQKRKQRFFYYYTVLLGYSERKNINNNWDVSCNLKTVGRCFIDADLLLAYQTRPEDVFVTSAHFLSRAIGQPNRHCCWKGRGRKKAKWVNQGTSRLKKFSYIHQSKNLGCFSV